MQFILQLRQVQSTQSTLIRLVQFILPPKQLQSTLVIFADKQFMWREISLAGQRAGLGVFFWNPRLSGGLFLPINEGRGLTGRGGGGEGGPVWIMQGSYCFMFQSGFHNNDFIVKF